MGDEIHDEAIPVPPSANAKKHNVPFNFKLTEVAVNDEKGVCGRLLKIGQDSFSQLYNIDSHSLCLSWECLNYLIRSKSYSTFCGMARSSVILFSLTKSVLTKRKIFVQCQRTKDATGSPLGRALEP